MIISVMIINTIIVNITIITTLQTCCSNKYDHVAQTNMTQTNKARVCNKALESPKTPFPN